MQFSSHPLREQGRWKCANVQLSNIQNPVSNDDGMSIGCCLLVHGLSPGEATLGVTVLDYSDEKMKFDLEVVE